MIEALLVGYDEGDRQEDALALARSVAELNGKGVIDPGPSSADALTDLVEQHTADLVVIGSSDRARPGTTLPASVGDALLRAPPCAVAIAPLGFAHQRSGLRRLGVGYDGSPGARAALSLAAGLATDGSAWLELIAVASPPLDGAVGNGSPSSASVENGSVSRRAELERAVADALDRIPKGTNALAEAGYGLPTRSLVRRTAALDLIAVGSRAHGRPGDPLGSVSSGLLAGDAGCPILIAPPTTEESEAYTSRGSRLART